jgi:hypothetical protein
LILSFSVLARCSHCPRRGARAWYTGSDVAGRPSSNLRRLAGSAGASRGGDHQRRAGDQPAAGGSPFAGGVEHRWRAVWSVSSRPGWAWWLGDFGRAGAAFTRARVGTGSGGLAAGPQKRARSSSRRIGRARCCHPLQRRSIEPRKFQSTHRQAWATYGSSIRCSRRWKRYVSNLPATCCSARGGGRPRRASSRSTPSSWSFRRCGQCSRSGQTNFWQPHRRAAAVAFAALAS